MCMRAVLTESLQCLKLVQSCRMFQNACEIDDRGAVATQCSHGAVLGPCAILISSLHANARTLRQLHIMCG